MKKVPVRYMLSLMIGTSKLEKALDVLCLYCVDKTSQRGVTSGEHIALTLTMKDSHLLLDVGKTILSMYLAPGETKANL